jgi:hypothetical protein
LTFDPVPWFVGGGAEHSPEVARLLAYAATSGAEGVVNSGDLKVVALSTPGAGVNVLTGSCLIINRASGGSQQTYVGRMVSQDTVNIAATGSGSARRDLIIARIEDPFVAGSPFPDPADVKVGPYIRTHVLSNVPLSAIADHDAAAAYLRTVGETAIPLAGINLPINTTAITTGMIVNLRKVAQPRSETVSKVSGQPPVGQANTATAFARWITPASWTVPVPTWATHAIIRVDVINAIHYEADVFGTLGLFMGSTLVASGPYAEDWNGASTRSNQVAANDVALSSSVRGTNQTFALHGLRSSPSGYLTTDAQTRVLLDISFVERAV